MVGGMNESGNGQGERERESRRQYGCVVCEKERVTCFLTGLRNHGNERNEKKKDEKI